MVRQLIFICLYCLALPLQAAQLRVELDKQQVEIGKYLNARIVYVGQQSVGLAMLGQWQTAFVIDRRDHDSDNLPDGQIQTVEHLRLYPRAVGETVLESIALGGTKAKPMRVRVKPAVRNGIDGTPKWQQLPDKVWQGQTFEISVKVGLLHHSNHIAVESAEFPGFTVAPLKSLETTQQGIRYKLLRWQLTAQTPGLHTLDAPAIEQRGHGRWRYYLPLQNMEVLPLPAYLPASVPVGKPQIKTAVVNGHYWEVRYALAPPVSEHPYGLYTGLAAIASQPVSAIKLLTATEGSGPAFRVPLPDWSWGRFSQPSLTLPYFDTQAGQLQETLVVMPALWRLPLAAKIILGLLALVGFVAGYFLVRPLIKHWQLRRQIRQIMATHLAPCAKRKALLALSGAQTLRELSDNWPFVQAADLCALDKACFGATPSAHSTHK